MSSHIAHGGRGLDLAIADVRLAYRRYLANVTVTAKANVEEGGGIWVGIQKCEGMTFDLVLFNSPKTGSTLALKTTEITSELVRKHIANSDAKFVTQRSTLLSAQEKIQ